jgi:hypothetical protein
MGFFNPMHHFARSVGARLGQATGMRVKMSSDLGPFPTASYASTPRPVQFIAGLDLGQATDFTALAIAEVLESEEGRQRRKEYTFRHLQRWPLGTSYSQIVEDLDTMLARLDSRPHLIVDGTGCGRPVVDMMRTARLPVAKLAPAIITAGAEATFTDGYWRVPKRDLAGAAVTAFESRRLHIVPKLKEAATLTRELQTFTVKINLATGNESFESWRERDHDDLVLAVALAVWYGDRCQRRLTAESFYV